MVKSIKYRILFWFVVLSVIILGIIMPVNFHYFKNKEEVADLINSLHLLHNDILRVINVNSAFFRNEITSDNYFITGKSDYLEEHNKLIQLLEGKIKTLKISSRKNHIQISDEIDSLRHDITEYDYTFRQIVNLIYERGYKDYGVEGRMRDYIHMMEDIPNVDQTYVLSLRRHEKDYIIRSDDIYIKKLNRLAEKFKTNIINSPGISYTEKDSLISILDHYKLLFNNMVALDKRIGIHGNQGMKSKLDKLSARLETHIEKLISMGNYQKHIIFRRMKFYHTLFAAIFIVVSIFLSLLITKQITNPLFRLTEYISSLTKSDFKKSNGIHMQKADREIEMIYNEFNGMVEKLERREKQRDRAIFAVKEEERRYRELADLLPICVFEINEFGRFTYVNKTLLQKFGYEYDQLINNLSIMYLMKEKDQENILEKEILDNYEINAVAKDGSSFPALVYTTSISGKVNGKRGIIIDITDRKRYVEALRSEKMRAEESDKLKTAFLANMSHEIRTPMNAIIGFSELLAIDELDQEKKKTYINQIKNSSQLLLNIIDDIIDIAKIEAGKVNINMKDCNIIELIDNLVLHFSGIVAHNKNKDINIIFKRLHDPNFIIKTDPMRVKQIFTNIIGNAVKFTTQGTIEIGYEMLDQYIEFYVQDTGIGIPEEKIDLIFERFRQVEETFQRSYGGTGLGLSITKNLVELLGGEIWVESKVNKGSRFAFTIPNNPVDQENKKIEEIPEENVNYHWHGKKVLIAEDDDTSFFLLSELLTPYGIKITRAINGIEAVRLFKESQFNIVLMDIHMPAMNGYEATRQIKEINSSVPIIAQTAYAMSKEKYYSRQSGCDDFVSKPINKDQLLFKIQYFMLLQKEKNAISIG